MTIRSVSKGKAAALSAMAVSSLLLVAACGSGDTQPADGDSTSEESASKTVVFSPLALKIPAMKQLSEGVTAFGESQGLEVVVQDPNLDPQKQVTDLQTAIGSGKADGVWAIMVAPEAAAALLPVAQDKGVPMVVNGTPEAYGLDGMVPGVSFSTIDYEAQGQAIGEELGNCINEKLGGKAEVIMQENAPGVAGKKELESAAQAALAETAPDAEIVTSIVSSDRAQVQTDMGSALQGNPDVQAVLGNNDEGSLGAIGAFKAAGKELACVTNGGGNEETLAAVESGEIYAVVALQFQDDMAQSMEKLIEMMDDPEAEGVQLVTPQKVVKAGS